MEFNEDDKRRAWRNYFANASMGMDVFGRVIYQTDFELDHIWPEAHGGINDLWNALPLHKQSNREKADNFKGVVNGHTFEVIMTGVTGIGALRVDGILIQNKRHSNSY